MKRILIEKKNGMFNLQNIYIQLRAAQDGVYEFMMKRVRKKRTINQNDWLWGAVYPLLLDAMIISQYIRKAESETKKRLAEKGQDYVIRDFKLCIEKAAPIPAVAFVPKEFSMVYNESK